MVYANVAKDVTRKLQVNTRSVTKAAKPVQTKGLAPPADPINIFVMMAYAYVTKDFILMLHANARSVIKLVQPVKDQAQKVVLLAKPI
jgi:hypothetical protein